MQIIENFPKLELKTRVRGRFVNCQPDGKTAYFQVGIDYKEGEHNKIKMAAVAYAKKKDWTAIINHLENATNMRVNDVQVEYPPGVYVTFQAKEKVENKEN